MSGVQFFWNEEELGKVLQQFADETAEAAEQVAENIRAKVPADVEVTVTNTTNRKGRPVSLVTIAHASGLARQAKHGTVTLAAAEAGLEVRRR